MVPARSTTANTMTAQSSLRTDMVMLANAGSWCINSNNCSVSVTEETGEKVEKVKDANKGLKRLDTRMHATRTHTDSGAKAALCLGSLHPPYFKPRRNELEAEKQDGSTPRRRINKGIITYKRQKSIRSIETFPAALSRRWQPIQWPQYKFREINNIQFSIRLSHVPDLSRVVILFIVIRLFSHLKQRGVIAAHF